VVPGLKGPAYSRLAGRSFQGRYANWELEP
jgi:hypothetical protein